MTREVRAQFEAFADAFGRPPDFVDGHQHVHLFPQVREAVLETRELDRAERLGAPVRRAACRCTAA